MKDQGRITAKQLLPISRFVYGPLVFANGEANVQIGKLICSGKGNSFFYIPPETYKQHFSSQYL